MGVTVMGESKWNNLEIISREISYRDFVWDDRNVLKWMG